MRFSSRLGTRTLAIEFLILLTAVMLAGYVAIFVTQYHSQSDYIEKNLDTRARSMGGLLANISIEPLLSHDFVALNDYLEAVISQNDVSFVIIAGKDKQLLAAHFSEEMQGLQDAVMPNLGNPGLPDMSRLVQGGLSVYEYPVTFNNEQLANITLGLDSRSSSQTLITNVITLSLVIFAVWFAAGLGIFLIFRRRVSNPLQTVVSSADDIAHLRFDKTVPVTGANEIGQLALTFNEMRIQLRSAVEARNQSMQELKELNVNLEERVAERTRELEKLNREVAYQALHDPLTGLANRLLIVERIDFLIRQAHRNSESFAVLMMDLDNFKEVNDTLGHPVGDELLRQVAERLNTTLRESDLVGRLGGDEFAMLLQDLGGESAKSVAEKIYSIMQQPFTVDHHTLTAEGSIGIAIYPDHGVDHATLLRCSDVAMYHAKRRGNQVALYSTDIDIHSLQRLALATDLRTACTNNELELHYQPIVDLTSGKVIGVEALARWNHPQYGLISPDEFIPIAENTGLIKQLTESIMKTAVTQWLDWHEQGLDLQIGLNISMLNLVDQNMPATVARIIRHAGLPTSAVKLEITETEIMSNPELVIEVLGHKELSGLKSSVDDFGTGYSSLSYLKKLPVQEIKIDRSFVTHMAVDEEDASIVRAVLELGHSLGLDVVAEGVEDEEALRELIALGCDYAQGFYFSRPVPADDLPEQISFIEARFYRAVSRDPGAMPKITH
jgi:diguanylate cyclase (GGDEF)-like protein